MMASWVNSAHKHLVCWRSNLAKDLAWRIVRLWQKNIRDGNIKWGNVNKEASIVFGNGILGIHKQASIRNNAPTCTKSQQENVGDGGVDITFLERCKECKPWCQHRCRGKAHKVQAMASKRDTQNETQRWSILRFLNLDTHKFAEREFAF
jgi:hypothetical protein